MIILPSDYKIEKYGIWGRLVTLDDAEYLLKLRTNITLGEFINPAPKDIQAQIDWMLEYKKREKEGTDYYFIYFYQDKPIGVCRIYNISYLYCTGGSWICEPNNKMEWTIATNLITKDVMFDVLKIKVDIFDVRKGNTKVWKFHKSMGAKLFYESDVDYFFTLVREDYIKCRDRYLAFLNK